MEDVLWTAARDGFNAQVIRLNNGDAQLVIKNAEDAVVVDVTQPLVNGANKGISLDNVMAWQRALDEQV
jgi:hypothetical protein